MGDASDDHEPLLVIDRVHDSIVADADSIVVASGERDNPDGSGLARECVNGGSEAGPQRVMEAPIGARGLGMKPDLIWLARHDR
jgi:hypothetical protein